MIGGMVGNNSSGSTSIKYGVTRDKVLQIDGILSDGSKATFKEISSREFKQKTQIKSLEGSIYASIYKNFRKNKFNKKLKTNFQNQVFIEEIQVML